MFAHDHEPLPGSLTETLHIDVLRRKSLDLLWEIAHWNFVNQARELEAALRYYEADLKAGFNPGQPRDDNGRWTDGGGSGVGGGGGAGDIFEGIGGSDIGNGTLNFDDGDIEEGDGGADTLEGAGTVMDDSGRIYYENATVPDSWADPDLNNFERHLEEHGSDFNSRSPEDYADQAYQFRQTAIEEDFPAIEYPNGGEIGIYDPANNNFGLYTSDGRTITYYKPTSPTYFQRETQDVIARGGRVINPLPVEEPIVPNVIIPE